MPKSSSPLQSSAPSKRSASLPPPQTLWADAASVLHRVLRGGSLKSILAPLPSQRARPVNALVTETLKKRRLLSRFVAAVGPFTKNGKASDNGDELRLLLAHEALFGRGLRQPALLRGAAENATLAEALEKMRAWEAAALKSARAAGRGRVDSDDEPSSSSDDATAKQLPRYARVNSLKAGVEQVIEILCESGWRLIEPPIPGKKAGLRPGASSSAALTIPIPDAVPEPMCFWRDPHVANLLTFPPHTELHRHALVASSALILQDKASCLAPTALDPRPNELILDCCAAPGNKTTQLAALSAPLPTAKERDGIVIACERDARRAGVLKQRAMEAAGECIYVLQKDFLSIDQNKEPFCDVTALQLDPTCSGTGMVESASFDIPTADGDDSGSSGVSGGSSGAGASSAEKPPPPGCAKRLQALAAMQLSLLKHALSFPSARVVVYSTCSVHPIENELVVKAALADEGITGEGGGWKLATAIPQWPCRGLPLLGSTALSEMLVRAGPEVGTNGFFVARFERTAWWSGSQGASGDNPERPAPSHYQEDPLETMKNYHKLQNVGSYKFDDDDDETVMVGSEFRRKKVQKTSATEEVVPPPLA